MPIEFKGSEGRTLGVEEEHLIVDATTGELAPKIEEIMSQLPEDLKEVVSYELFQSVLEIKTPPCATVSEATALLQEFRSRVISCATDCGAALAGADESRTGHVAPAHPGTREQGDRRRISGK